MDAMLAAKLALEAEVAPPLLENAERYIRDWVTGAGVVHVRTTMEHQGAFEAILVRHYARVCMVVTGREPNDRGDLSAAAINWRHAERLRRRATQQSLLIIKSIERELSRALVAVESQKATFIEFETKDSLGSFTIRMAAKFVDAAKKAAAAIAGKMPQIANVQTQEPAEEAVFEWVEDNKDANSTIIQVWSTMQDERVRPAHVEAEGQERRIDQPFDVGGERLRFPGDTGLGASLWNVINCRCSAVFYAVDGFGNRRDMQMPTPRAPTRPSRRPGDQLPRQLSPTEFITLNGTTRARIVLGDGKTIATMRQTSPSVIEVLVGRRVIARATHARGRVTSSTIDPAFGSQGIAQMIRRSVEHSFSRVKP